MGPRVPVKGVEYPGKHRVPCERNPVCAAGTETVAKIGAGAPCNQRRCAVVTANPAMYSLIGR